MPARIWLHVGLASEYCKMYPAITEDQMVYFVDEKDLNAVKDSLKSEIAQHRAELSLLRDTVADHRRTLNTTIQSLNTRLAAETARLDSIYNMCQELHSVVMERGQLEQTLQRITDGHFQRVNDRLLRSELITKEAAATASSGAHSSSNEAERASGLVEEARLLMASARSENATVSAEADKLRQNIKGQADGYTRKINEIEALLRNLRRQESETRAEFDKLQQKTASFQKYVQRAGWSTFWGRLRWLFTGVM